MKKGNQIFFYNNNLKSVIVIKGLNKNKIGIIYKYGDKNNKLLEHKSTIFPIKQNNNDLIY